MQLPALCSLSFLCLHLSATLSFLFGLGLGFYDSMGGAFPVLFFLDLLFLSWPLSNQDLLFPSHFFSTLIPLLLSLPLSLSLFLSALCTSLQVRVNVVLLRLCAEGHNGCPELTTSVMASEDREGAGSKQERIHFKKCDLPLPYTEAARQARTVIRCCR